MPQGWWSWRIRGCMRFVVYAVFAFLLAAAPAGGASFDVGERPPPPVDGDEIAAHVEKFSTDHPVRVAGRRWRKRRQNSFSMTRPCAGGHADGRHLSRVHRHDPPSPRSRARPVAAGSSRRACATRRSAYSTTRRSLTRCLSPRAHVGPGPLITFDGGGSADPEGRSPSTPGSSATAHRRAARSSPIITEAPDIPRELTAARDFWGDVPSSTVVPVAVTKGAKTNSASTSTATSMTPSAGRSRAQRARRSRAAASRGSARPRSRRRHTSAA